jgi:hypothetical protein
MEDDKKNMTDANDLASPKNIEKLYGNKAIEEDPPASAEATEVELPEDFDAEVDQEVKQNMYPSYPERPEQDIPNEY